ncbi:hypothetical protein MLD38_015101 [Melastoma candidum]|uniref:Uncharacterized protein n=1 Tax=Melastoma candidum TaxID=119954 RepID=A0ACB9REN0_9MYRT|nr:hypothetical protein MLD38_015101 [Melastoma candidum]
MSNRQISLHGGKPTLVRLDVEWRPNRIRYLSYETATLQLCIDDKCLNVQLLYITYIPESIIGFCGDPNFTFVGVEVADDVEKLRNEYNQECAKHADFRELAKMQWPDRFRRSGLKNLAREVGVVMMQPKHVTLSNWEARNLSIEQVEYACLGSILHSKDSGSFVVALPVMKISRPCSPLYRPYVGWRLNHFKNFPALD